MKLKNLRKKLLQRCGKTEYPLAEAQRRRGGRREKGVVVEQDMVIVV